MRRVVAMVLVLILFFCWSAKAQRTGLDLLGDKNKIEIPFTETNGLLMIQLKMNGIPLTFMFDTGAENTILFKKEIAQLLGLQSNRRIKIIGSDLSNIIYGYIVHNVEFKLDYGIERIESIIVLEENVYKIQESTGHQVDGLLGGNFFRNTIVKVDYKRRHITVSHPINHKHNLKGYTEIGSTFKEQKPYLKARLETYEGNSKELFLLIDTGSSIPFIVHTNVDSSLQVPQNVIRGNLGVGLSGTIIGLIGIIKALEFNGFIYREMLTNFQDLDESVLKQKDIMRHGILGNDILKRFTIIIDYFHRKIYFKPTKNYNKAFKYDKSGLVIIASGLDFNEYYVQSVIADSPAEKAGLKKGDKLHSIQRIPVAFRSLNNIQRLFKKKEGTKVRLVVKRDDEKLLFQFELKDMLKENYSHLFQNKRGIVFSE